MNNIFSGHSVGKGNIVEGLFWSNIVLNIILYLHGNGSDIQFNSKNLNITFIQFELTLNDIIKTLNLINIFLSFYLFILFFRHFRIMEDTPTSKLRSCAQGYVELEGIQKNMVKYSTISMLSKTPCTWYAYKIHKHVKRGKNSAWELIEEGQSKNPFILDDNTGLCVILPEKAKIISTTTRKWQGYAKKTPYPVKESFFSIFGSYKFTEYLLLPNSYLYAIGMLQTKNQINFLTNKNIPKRRPFILSSLGKRLLLNRYKIKSIIYFCLACVLIYLLLFL